MFWKTLSHSFEFSTHVFTRRQTHANESPQCGFLMKEEAREELQR